MPNIEVTNASVIAALSAAGMATDAEMSTADNLKVAKTGDTMTGDLTVSASDPTIYVNTTDGGGQCRVTFNHANGLMGYVEYDPATGNFTWRGSSSRTGGQPAKNFIQFRGADNVLVLDGSAVEVPAISGTSQAAQVTAYNATTGQLAIGGHEVGDTGWRNVSGSLLNSWSASGGMIWLRRVGVYCSLQWQLDGTSATSGEFLTLPSGFRPGGGSLAYTAAGAALVPPSTLLPFRHGNDSESYNVRMLGTYTVATIRGISNWTTIDSWPTSLPGTAA